jgi:hypothetical protein
MVYWEQKERDLQERMNYYDHLKSQFESPGEYSFMSADVNLKSNMDLSKELQKSDKV